MNRDSKQICRSLDLIHTDHNLAQNLYILYMYIYKNINASLYTEESALLDSPLYMEIKYLLFIFTSRVKFDFESTLVTLQVNVNMLLIAVWSYCTFFSAL